MKQAGLQWIRTVLINRTKRYLTRFWPFQSVSDHHFIILCRPRTGSTLLHTSLNSHPAIFSYGELPRKNLEKGITNSIEQHLFKKHPPSIKAVGLKVFYDYLDSPEYRKFVFELSERPEVKVLHLKRRNALDEFISLEKAKKRNIWSSTDGNSLSPVESINPDPDEFRRFLALRAFLSRRAEYIFQGHPVLEVYYEDLIGDSRSTLMQIQQFLGVKRRNLFSLLTKMGDPLHRDIANYKALKEIYESFPPSE